MSTRTGKNYQDSPAPTRRAVPITAAGQLGLCMLQFQFERFDTFQSFSFGPSFNFSSQLIGGQALHVLDRYVIR